MAGEMSMEKIHQRNKAFASQMSTAKQSTIQYEGDSVSQKQADRAMIKARALESANRANYNRNIGASLDSSVECKSADDIQCPEGEGWLRVTD